MRSFKFPDRKSIENQLRNTRSYSEVSSVNGKTYVDAHFGVSEVVNIRMDNIHLNGHWDFILHDLSELSIYELRIISRHYSDESIIINFPSILERKKFVESLTVERPVQQTSNGMDLEAIVNGVKVKEIAIGALVFGSIYGAYKLVRSHKDTIVNITKSMVGHKK